jgi:hypothetical protein
MGLHIPLSYNELDKSRRKSRERDIGDADGPLELRSPMSQSEEEDLEAEGEEFVDAPDSQYNPTSEREDVGVQADLLAQEPVPYQQSPSKALVRTPAPPSKDDAADQKWRKRVEQALVKMTAEVAALREQLESRRLFNHTRRYKFFRWVVRFVWGTIKHLAVDIIILGLILLWLRRKKDRRLEGAVSVLLGDAVGQVQRVSGAQIGKIQLPRLVGGSKKGGAS